MLEIRLDGEDDGIGSAITDDVIALDWRIGMQRRYDALSVPGYAWIVLNNRTGSYSPERGAALSGKWVTIRDEERIYFSGIIVQVEPLAGEYGDKSVRLIAQGREAELQQQILDLPVMTQVESGAALHAILDRIRLRRRGLAGYCIPDAANHNLIDSVSIFTPYDDDRSLQTGKTRFGLLAEAPLSALEQIRRIVSAEGGRFYFNRAAAARFVDRHYLLQNDDTAATFSDDMRGLTYVYGDDVVNHVTIELIPLTIGAEKSILWSLPAALSLARGTTHRIRALYTLDAQPVQALSLERLVRGIDFEATTLASGGKDASVDISVGLLEAGADSALLEIRNQSTSMRHLQRLDLRGTPLLQGNPLTIERTDLISSTFYGVRQRRITVPDLGSLQQADALAESELLRRSQPRGRVQTVTLDARQHPQALAITLLDRVRLIESQTGHNAAYTIIAEQHRVTQGGTLHRIEWLLEPADSERFFVLDTHALDSERILSPR